ncbi:factor-independent urate hydroxylase [Bacillus tequilensis]|uniref:factor-independent urate hydroxylase n=1 Tax=Bacillus tequilensis TaxID=227866 RepID=UPI00046390F4|nr:urate oxidase [Bacillus tequilensis]MDR4436350.1 urate oxidase [Bacillus tequilensis]SPT94342.1 urate oxidase with peroxide reductase N-terminal domain [Bacillus tequilensis]
MFTMNDLNQMDRHTLTDTLGSIFEHSSWIAEEAAELRPFSSLSDLHRKMAGILKAADRQTQLNLINKHPRLGTKNIMSDASVSEQRNAGLSKLEQEEYEEFLKLNEHYDERFGFPFILAVKGKTKQDIHRALVKRLENEQETEFQQALIEIYRIARFRLADIITEKGETQMKRTMSYGKGNVFAYRTFLKPLTGVKQIPESSFSGRDNTVVGVDVTCEIGGDAFLPSFIDGDNTLVVATDSMKNFIQRHLASYEGTTIEGFLHDVAHRFLNTYSHMDTITLTGEEIPFEAMPVYDAQELRTSQLVFRRSRNERARSVLKAERTGDTITIKEQYSEIIDLQLVKVSGNSFVGFIRDEYTTLPEDGNRPLFVHLNIGWHYENTNDAYASDPARYVAAEQVRDLASAVFHELETPSIQNLIYHIGCRILTRFPQLTDVTFQSQNHTWDTVVEEIPGSKGKVYTEPRPPFGFQRFTVTREDAEKEKQKATEEFRSLKA